MFFSTCVLFMESFYTDPLLKFLYTGMRNYHWVNVIIDKCCQQQGTVTNPAAPHTRTQSWADICGTRSGEPVRQLLRLHDVRAFISLNERSKRVSYTVLR